MYNYFFLIGRITHDVELKRLADGRGVLNIGLAVQRPFKNANGEYDTDFFTVTLWESIAEIAAENFKKGSAVGIKGRMTQRKITLESGVNANQIELTGERIVFFSNSDTKVEG